MNFVLRICLCLFVFSIPVQGQSLQIEPAAATKNTYPLPSHLSGRLADHRFVQITDVTSMLEARPMHLDVRLGQILPVTAPPLPETIRLERFDVRASDARLVAETDEGQVAVPVRFAAYRGNFEDGGWITLHLTPSGVRGLVRHTGQTWVLEPARQPSASTPDALHLLYETGDLEHAPNFCGTDTGHLPDELEALMVTLDLTAASKTSVRDLLTVELAVETDYETYLDFGSDLEATTAYLLSTIASVSQIYTQELDIELQVVFSRVWTTPEDPYTGNGNGLLFQFSSHWNSQMQDIERDMALLLIRDPLRLAGGLAELDSNCESNRAYAISGDGLKIVAHEIGHVLGAPHTHNCAWPAGAGGTLAPIDQCAPVEGACGIDEIVRTDGTVMSYCSVPVLTLHPLVGNLIRDRTETKTCTGTGAHADTFHTVSGTVTSEDAGLANVTVTAIGRDTTVTATTTDDGSFSMQLPDGTFDISADRDFYVVSSIGYTLPWITAIVAGTDMTGLAFQADAVFPDSFEPDDALEAATEIPTDGTFQERTLHSNDDLDYVRFTVEADQAYEIELHLERHPHEGLSHDEDHGGPPGTAPPTITLLDTDGVTVLAEETHPHGIHWEIDQIATYFIRIGGGKTFYDLSVSPETELFVETKALAPPPRLDARTPPAVAWGDVDRDGDLDLALSGLILGQDIEQITLYRNDDDTLVDTETAFTTCTSSCFPEHSLEFGDYDRDGDLDLLEASDHEVRLYFNEAGTFSTSLLVGENLALVQSATGGDYDNDGDLDILIAAFARTDRLGDYPALHLYRNDDGTFVNTEFDQRGVQYGKAIWGDVDTDGDLDILVAGSSFLYTNAGGGAYTNPFVALYHNDGGTFTGVETEIGAVAGYPDMAFADFDSDGDQDLLVIGAIEAEIHADFYHNEQGTFTFDEELEGHELPDRPFSQNWGVSLDVGDVDNDGDIDVITAGRDRFNDLVAPSTALWINEEGHFSESPFNEHLPPVIGSVSWVDVDERDHLDLFLVGENGDGTTAHLLHNQSEFRNTPPVPPAGLSATFANGAVSLFWFPATDDRTETEALTYNIRVGTTPGGVDVVSPHADVETGQRFVVAPGNVGALTQRTLYGLEAGQTYYWSVQAVDNSYAGSAWAPEQSFVPGQATPVEHLDTERPRAFALEPGYPNPFRGRTTIRFEMPEQAEVRVVVFDLLGQAITTLASGVHRPGRYEAQWDANALSSGVYVCRMQAGSYEATTKLIVLQ